MSNPWIATAALIGAIIGDIPRQEQEYQKQGELSHPNSLTNKALKAQKDASQTIGRIHYSFVPAPNPLMNGPSMLLGGVSRKDLPPTETPGAAMTVVAALNEANDYLEATGQIPVRPRIRDDYSANAEYGELMRQNDVKFDEMAYGLNTEYDHLMRANRELEIAAMQPQSVQIITQPAAAAAPEQTINFNIANDFKGNWQDRRALNDIGEYLAQQVKDRLNANGVSYSRNW